MFLVGAIWIDNYKMEDCSNNLVDKVQKVFRNPNEDSLKKTLFKLRSSNCLTDFILIVNKVEYNVHKVVLVSSSKCFYDLFIADRDKLCDDDGNHLVESYSVPVSEAGFCLVLDYMYTDNLVFTLDNVADVLEAAQAFQMDELLTFGFEFLSANINAANALSTYYLACRYGVEMLRKRSYQMIMDHLPSLSFSDFKTFVYEKDEGGEVLMDDEMIFTSVTRWVKHNPVERKPFFDGFVEHVEVYKLPSKMMRDALADECLGKSPELVEKMAVVLGDRAVALEEEKRSKDDEKETLKKEVSRLRAKKAAFEKENRRLENLNLKTRENFDREANKRNEKQHLELQEKETLRKKIRTLEHAHQENVVKLKTFEDSEHRQNEIARSITLSATLTFTFTNLKFDLWTIGSSKVSGTHANFADTKWQMVIKRESNDYCGFHIYCWGGPRYQLSWTCQLNAFYKLLSVRTGIANKFVKGPAPITFAYDSDGYTKTGLAQFVNWQEAITPQNGYISDNGEMTFQLILCKC